MALLRYSFILVGLWLMNRPVTLFAQQENSKDEINEVWESFISAWESLDASSCADFYLEDGLNVPPELPGNRGRKAIEDFYAGLFEAHQSSTYKHNTHFVEKRGDLLIEYAEFHVDWVTNDGDSWQYKARAMVHWQKNGQGEWKIKTLLFNQAP